MVDLLLKHHKIYGTIIAYPTIFEKIYTAVRFNIAIEQTIFNFFVDRLELMLQ